MTSQRCKKCANFTIVKIPSSGERFDWCKYAECLCDKFFTDKCEGYNGPPITNSDKACELAIKYTNHGCTSLNLRIGMCMEMAEWKDKEIEELKKRLSKYEQI